MGNRRTIIEDWSDRLRHGTFVSCELAQKNGIMWSVWGKKSEFQMVYFLVERPELDRRARALQLVAFFRLDLNEVK
jgi:hypothetical protein